VNPITIIPIIERIVTARRSINRSENVEAKPFDKSTFVPLFNRKARIASPAFAGVIAKAKPDMKTLKL
jgi:hypothetical protein